MAYEIEEIYTQVGKVVDKNGHAFAIRLLRGKSGKLTIAIGLVKKFEGIQKYEFQNFKYTMLPLEFSGDLNSVSRDFIIGATARLKEMKQEKKPQSSEANTGTEDREGDEDENE